MLRNHSYILAVIVIFRLLASPVLAMSKAPGNFESRLAGLDVTSRNVTKIIIVGNEHSYTSGITVTIENRVIIEKIFSFFSGARQYEHWVASGFWEVQIFTKSSTSPALVLYVNETDLTQLQNDKIGYHCKGLDRYLGSLLEPFAREISEGMRSP
ncbi:MAG: hypothetical protein P8075_11540 [Deltaproteobacteria bacterium]|jgi:hypothetical protein